MSRRLPIVIAVIALTALSLAGEEKASLEKKVGDAREQVRDLKLEMEYLYVAIDADFQLVRSDRWRELSRPLTRAIDTRMSALRETPEKSAALLAADFDGVKLLSEAVNRRIAANVAGRVSGLARGESMSGRDLLAKAVVEVFPEKTFDKCWDEAFQDLPLVAKWREANEVLAAVEKALATLTDEPKVPDAPPGMVLVPDGRYSWGPWVGLTYDLKKNREEKVRISAFYIDVHEMTNRGYLEFLRNLKKSRREEYLADGFSLDEDGGVTLPEDRLDYPARGMTWGAARACAKYFGKRLPTEEEWEVAARGEKGLMYPWGDEFKKGAANTSEEKRKGPVPVGSMAGDVSPFGVHDMGGNVSEMTKTFMDRQPVRGEPGTEHTIAFRGGNYAENQESAATTYRWSLRAVGERQEKVGFRCVLSKKDWKKK